MRFRILFLYLYHEITKSSNWLKMSCSYYLLVVIGYKLVSYLLFYSSVRCVTSKELSVRKRPLVYMCTEFLKFIISCKIILI